MSYIKIFNSNIQRPQGNQSLVQPGRPQHGDPGIGGGGWNIGKTDNIQGEDHV